MNNGMNDFSSKDVMELNGWIFNNIDKSHDTFNVNGVNESCGPSRNPNIANTWYGWATQGAIGGVTLFMKGFGSAKLIYGNCYEGNSFGSVKVYLNSIEISQAGPGEIKEIHFDYEHNSILKMEEDHAIIKIHHLAWNCSSKIFYLMYYFRAREENMISYKYFMYNILLKLFRIISKVEYHIQTFAI